MRSRGTAGIAKMAIIGAVAASQAGPARAAADPGYGEYALWEDWARLQVGAQAGLASSYDREGGNRDYCHYEWPEGLIYDEVVATVKTIDGPGVIYRFWMPHVTSDLSFVVRMFFDGEPTPRIDTTSDVLLTGAFGYFTPPLVDTCAGGQVCYEPIPFAESLRIETVNHEIPPDQYSRHRHYYQYTYKTFGAHTSIASYTGTLTPEQQGARAAMIDLFNNAGQHPAGASATAVHITTSGVSVPPGSCLAVAGLTGPGIIRRLHVGMGSAGDLELDALKLRVTYDNEVEPAIDVSVADFFGAGHQRAVYQSIPLGTDSPDGFYCYWPMPFRESLWIELCNTGTNGAIPIDGAGVEVEPGPVTADLCYLHVESYTDYRAAGQVYHPILSATGRGHYVGNLLYTQQVSDSFQMLEGDEIITVDGAYTLNGTGLEDAYNGGYYYNWVAIQWDEPEGGEPPSAIRPVSGILHVDWDPGALHARADQYRWQIADRVPFHTSIDVKIENQYAVVGAEFTSVAFWYRQPPIPGDADGDGDLDLADFAQFQRCFADGTSGCLDLYDYDGDLDVDLGDFDSFLASFSGPL